MNAYDKARLFPEPDPLAAILCRFVRLTMIPPPPAAAAPAPRVENLPASDAWRAVLETAIPTVSPRRPR
jgi:hypothetical protein